jgi:hypothetical protein
MGVVMGVVMAAGAGGARLVCSGSLSQGAGSCTSSLFDLASSSSVGSATLTARLQPSGTSLGPVTVGQPLTTTVAPGQQFPTDDQD